MIPGKKYTPEDILEIAWRYRWVIVTPFVAVAIGATLWAQTLPDRYRSTAVILVEPPQVPQNYVRSTITEGLARRLDTMKKELLSRTVLEGLIRDFNLYEEMRREELMETVIARMQDDITVAIPQVRRREDPNSFQVSYESDNPKTAMAVADRLAALFVRRNSERRAVQADSAMQFLESQLETARQKLRDREQRLAEFRRINSGRLPTDVNSNLQMLKGAQDQLQALDTSMSQDRDRQLVIERTVADETALARAAPPPAMPGAGRGGSQTAPATAAGQLRAAETQLAELSLKLKADHPDIRSLKRRIEELKKLAVQEALALPVSDDVPLQSADPRELERQKRIASLKAEHESLERRLASKREQALQLQKTIAEYRARLDAAPGLESELTQLMRDYDMLSSTYSSLLVKSQDARVAASLEERQISEVFRIIESARVPPGPTSPDRIRLSALGALGGLVLGLAIAGVLEYRDRALRTEDDVVLTLALPVLALVPTMMTTAERRRHRRNRRLLLVSSGALALLLVLAVAASRHPVIAAWMR